MGEAHEAAALGASASVDVDVDGVISRLIGPIATRSELLGNIA
jgi:hypothetical protein